jgi:hypothetical protein
MADIAEEWQPVQLAAKVIGHISQGMYRTPAGAVKELISNAYDAGATYAKIHTGFPTFRTFSCEDDGSGISKEKFLQLMTGGIGDSDKHPHGQPLIGKNGRPIVGRLGVGLISLAQICSRFSISSWHAPSRTAFEAEIRFPPYARKEIDAVAEHPADPERLVQHGEYKCTEVPYASGSHGIVITTTYLRDTFRKTMSQLDSFAHKQFFHSAESYPSFNRFLEAITQLSSLYFASQYDQMLFGLALASPIPYVETSQRDSRTGTVATRIPPIAALQKQLKSFDFRVEFDNIQLRRPLALPSNKGLVKPADCLVPSSPEKVTFKLEDGVHSEQVTADKYDIPVRGRSEHFQLFYFKYDRKVNGYPLQFSGYIFLQVSRLYPKEFQGIVIRLRNVAIGQYDVNIMTYPLAEGPRFSMLSSEVFVTAGLDDALKVDRDGFNTLDPHYIRLQSFIHSILHELIFPGSWEEEKARNKQKREVREEEVTRTFAEKLTRTTHRQFTSVEIVPKAKDRRSTEPVEVDRGTRTVRIHASNPVTKTMLGRKKYHGIAARAIAAFEAANVERSPQERRRVFYTLIEDIFNE